MKRRESLKLIATGLIAGPAVVAGCKTNDEKNTVKAAEPEFTIDRNPEELKIEKELLAKEKFFNEHEMATITLLSDIIIPMDDVSGSASQAGVPAFIEFIVKDMPSHQTPMRGGLRWLDSESNRRFSKNFRELQEAEQIQIIDDIAYPQIKYKEDGKEIIKGEIKPGMEPGIAFFSLMRNLTATGFYTSQAGVADMGYQGNTPNQWNGVPPDVLKQYSVSYSEKDQQDCVSFTA
jgi:gluconate 2-dehydrogenase gamma chain